MSLHIGKGHTWIVVWLSDTSSVLALQQEVGPNQGLVAPLVPTNCSRLQGHTQEAKLSKAAVDAVRSN